jgi:aminoglycoside phosphotransferase (APT) family kinase protein
LSGRTLDHHRRGAAMKQLPGLDLDRLSSIWMGFFALRADRSTVLSSGRFVQPDLCRSDGGHRLVVRRPPLRHVLPTAHDMAREIGSSLH